MTLSAEGFSSEADYRANPRIEVPGKTTRGFLPGPIRPGEWAAELGVGAVIPKSDGDADGKVAWRVEIEFADDPAFADEPYQPTPYNRNPVRTTPGWYSGDFHVHAEHSAYGNATMIDSFNYAFTPVSKGGGGLDFITLSDYVSGSAWGEIGKFQPWFPHNLIIPSAEIITYKGHTNNHGSLHFVDYRTGPIYELQPDGTVKQIRGTRDPRQIFDEVHRFGGWTQINHPTIFPPVDAAAAALCRGCFWEYTSTQTDYSQVDAFEVATGPADIAGTQNPFTISAIARYEQLLTVGYKIAAVGSSDSHKAGDASGVLDAPIGEARTVVRARNLSMHGIRCGVLNRHTYAKVSGAIAPDIRFVARPLGANSSQRAIIGDTIHALGRQLQGARAGRERRPAVDRQGRRDRRDGAGHQQRLRLPLPGQRERPLAAPGDERIADPGRLDTDLDRARLERCRARALPLDRLGRHRPDGHAVGDDQQQRQAGRPAHECARLAAAASPAQRKAGQDRHHDQQQEPAVRDRVADADPAGVGVREVLLRGDPLGADAHDQVGRDPADQQRAEGEPQGRGAVVRAQRHDQHDRRRRQQRDEDHRAQHVEEQREVPGVWADGGEAHAPGLKIITKSRASTAIVMTAYSGRARSPSPASYASPRRTPVAAAITQSTSAVRIHPSPML